MSAHRLVELHGGPLTVESECSCFTVRLLRGMRVRESQVEQSA
ncbi:hypothetical protein [Archangium violaceum]|nr:hypothetical protein [Archangium violaceum]